MNFQKCEMLEITNVVSMVNVRIQWVPTNVHVTRAGLERYVTAP